MEITAKTAIRPQAENNISALRSTMDLFFLFIIIEYFSLLSISYPTFLFIPISYIGVGYEN